MTEDMIRGMFQVQLKQIRTLLCSDAWLCNISAGWYSVLLHLCNFSFYFYLLSWEECWIPTPALQLCCGFIYSRTREILLKLLYVSCHRLLISDGLASILRDTEVEMGNLPPAWWCFKFCLFKFFKFIFYLGFVWFFFMIRFRLCLLSQITTPGSFMHF